MNTITTLLTKVLLKEVNEIVDNEPLHQIGKFGSIETHKDEIISKSCMLTIFNFLRDKKIIDGYHFELDNGKIMMDIFTKKYNLDTPQWIENHGICPDIPTLYLVSDINQNEKHILCTGDDKFQNTGGNAIERVSKNYNFVLNYLMHDVDINPYVVFCSGGSFLNEENEPKDYFWCKLLQTFKFTKNGNPNIFWTYDSDHSSDKNNWNQVYVQKERFTAKQKLEILFNVINDSIEYYKTIL